MAGATVPSVTIVQLEPEVIHALAAGNLERARAASGLAMSEHFTDEDNLGTWRMRSTQLTAHPDDAGWITGAVVDTTTGAPVGRAGFHGPPDEHGMVEVGYAIDPPLRRRGYARATLGFLLDRARREPGVRVLRATISPGNIASERLVADFGLVEVGEQWDDEDGLEIIYELRLAGPAEPV